MCNLISLKLYIYYSFAGILDNSSLSFTSKDSYRLWQELEKLYPPDAIHKLNPHNFFSTSTRITLQSTKDYEDLLKKGKKRRSLTIVIETNIRTLKILH